MKALNYIQTTYQVELSLPQNREVVFTKLTDLSKWWPEQLIGGPLQPQAEFVLKTGDDHYSKNKVLEFDPGKKLVWQTTESLRKTDGYDWSGTKFIFELAPQGDYTLLRFTYDGPVLENEKERLTQICELCIKDLFYNYLIKKQEQ